MKKPALGMMIIESRKPLSAPPKYGAKREAPAAPPAPAPEPEPTEQESYHEGGGSIAPTPESVCYRTAAETCGNCEYMQGDQCAFLRQPVGPADSCARFEAKGEDPAIADHDAGGEDFEGDE